MPMIDADGCLLNVSVEGRDGGPTLMLSNSLGCDDADVGAADEGAHAGVSRHPLRPARPRQVERAARALFDGAFRPRRAGDPRRPQYRKDALVRAVDGRHGRTMAGRQCAGSIRQDHPRQHRLPLSGPDQLAQPHQGGEGRRHRRGRGHRDRRLADGGFSRARAADHRQHEGDDAGLAGAKAISPAARRFPRSISASCCRRSKARRW